MIRGEKGLPKDILERVTTVVPLVSSDLDVQALYLFGSGAQDRLRPLSDLDFGILLATRLDRKQRSEKQMDLMGKLNDFFGTDEIDLVILNDVPPRSSIKVIKGGKLLFFRDKRTIVDFCERVFNQYLDFKHFRTEFDRAFLEGIGSNG